MLLASDISPPPFNGKVGGIIAFDVAGTMNFNNYAVNVSGKGFRGGYSLIKAPTQNFANLYVTNADDSRTSGKGEGIAGTPRYMWDGFNQVDNVIEGLPNGSAGRGAPANAGGGGGNDTNSGGGGGGNGGAGGVGAWGYEPCGGTFPNGGRPGSGIYATGVADVNLQPQTTICLGKTTPLNPVGAGNYTYHWLPEVGLSDASVANPVASPNTTTTYTLTVTNGLCTAKGTITVNVIPPPTVNAGKDKEMLKGNSVLLDATTTGSDLQYSWSPTQYLDNPNIATPTASPTEDITYTLTVTSANNCFFVSDDVFIKVYPKINPPNTFTPNSDGVNDVWEIPGLSSYANGVISIFNRDGTLLHRSTGYPVPWNGTYQGKAVPFGTYYYIIDLKNGTKAISGWVAVVR